MIWLTRVTRVLAAGVVALLLALPAGTASASVTSPAPGSPRIVMILLDVSKALSNVETQDERQAALSYAQALPSDVEVGLVKFSDQWQEMLPPTVNRAELGGALNASHRSAETATAIYDALTAAEAAVKAAGGAAGSRLLVLSEGESIPDPTLTLTIRVDVVPWHSDADDNLAALQAIASQSGGRVAAPADAATLASAFDATSHAATPSPASSPSMSQGSPWELVLALACVFAAILSIGLLILASPLHTVTPGRRLETQLERHYTRRHRPGAAGGDGKADGDGKVASAAVGSVARLLGPSGERRLAGQLDLAGMSRKPAEWVVLGCAFSLVLVVLLTLLTGTALAGIPIGVLAGWLSMRLIVMFRISRRRSAFADQLPDVLQLVAGALQTGFSLPQALDAVVRENSQPAAGEFSRALAETRIGGELEGAMNKVADRMNSTDLRWTVMAIAIHRQVGGNLVEVLRTTVDTMRERAQMRRQVRALSAEGRLSAYILIALPVLMGAYMFLAKRDYIRPLYTTPVGLVMLIGGGVLVVVGTIWMRNVVKLEV
jgi:Flp pilus assembly protein TadB